jgi:hypothetical protein
LGLERIYETSDKKLYVLSHPEYCIARVANSQLKNEINCQKNLYSKKNSDNSICTS